MTVELTLGLILFGVFTMLAAASLLSAAILITLKRSPVLLILLWCFAVAAAAVCVDGVLL